MTEITDELVIRGNHIKNRIVMAPMVTFSFHGDNGSYYGKQHVEHYTKRAIGGTGLIIVQATSVFGALNSTGMWATGDIAALQQIANKSHNYGAVMMMQLSCGDVDINELSVADIHSMQQSMKRHKNLRKQALICCTKEVNIPVIAVNEIRTEAQVRFLIENEYVDLVAIGRGMLADPEFANHIINGEPVNMCSGCKRCCWFSDDTLCPATDEK